MTDDFAFSDELFRQHLRDEHGFDADEQLSRASLNKAHREVHNEEERPEDSSPYGTVVVGGPNLLPGLDAARYHVRSIGDYLFAAAPEARRALELHFQSVDLALTLLGKTVTAYVEQTIRPVVIPLPSGPDISVAYQRAQWDAAGKQMRAEGMTPTPHYTARPKNDNEFVIPAEEVDNLRGLRNTQWHWGGQLQNADEFVEHASLPPQYGYSVILERGLWDGSGWLMLTGINKSLAATAGSRVNWRVMSVIVNGERFVRGDQAT